MAPNTELGTDKKPKGLTRVHLGLLQHREDDTRKWEYAVRYTEIRGQLILDAARLGAYRFPPRSGTGSDVTSFLPALQQYGPRRESRAPLLFQLRKTAGAGTVAQGFMMYANTFVLDHNDHKIPDYQELPSTLSTQLEGHHIELFRRQNDRIEYKDLVTRMPQPSPDTNALQGRCRRFRMTAGCLRWDVIRPESPAIVAQIESILGPLCVNQNSSRPFGRDLTKAEQSSMVEANKANKVVDVKDTKVDKESLGPNASKSDEGGDKSSDGADERINKDNKAENKGMEGSDQDNAQQKDSEGDIIMGNSGEATTHRNRPLITPRLGENAGAETALLIKQPEAPVNSSKQSTVATTLLESGSKAPVRSATPPTVIPESSTNLSKESSKYPMSPEMSSQTPVGSTEAFPRTHRPTVERRVRFSSFVEELSDDRRSPYDDDLPDDDDTSEQDRDLASNGASLDEENSLDEVTRFLNDGRIPLLQEVLIDEDMQEYLQSQEPPRNEEFPEYLQDEEMPSNDNFSEFLEDDDAPAPRTRARVLVNPRWDPITQTLRDEVPRFRWF